MGEAKRRRSFGNYPTMEERFAEIAAMTDPAERQRALDEINRPASRERIKELVDEFYDTLIADRVEHFRTAVLPRQYPEAVLTEAVRRLMATETDWPSTALVINTCEAVVGKEQ